jgi:hypothetical protein
MHGDLWRETVLWEADAELWPAHNRPEITRENDKQRRWLVPMSINADDRVSHPPPPEQIPARVQVALTVWHIDVVNHPNIPAPAGQLAHQVLADYLAEGLPKKVAARIRKERSERFP